MMPALRVCAAPAAPNVFVLSTLPNRTTQALAVVIPVAVSEFAATSQHTQTTFHDKN
jgi:hypothetical protein